MPDIDQCPTNYAVYLKLAKSTHKTTALKHLTRFAFRYRLAKDFTGLKAPNVGKTLAGYDVITKLFLAYTAYEAIITAARYLSVRSVLQHELNTRFEPELAIKLRSNEKLKEFLLTHPQDAALTNKVKLFFDGTTSDIVCIAYSLRNIFAHGDLTASPIGTETIAKREVFTSLADAILVYCDETFSNCLPRL
jgi:hypothetical protein